jgi:diaminopimelate epimerase
MSASAIPNNWDFSKLHGLGNDFVVGELETFPVQTGNETQTIRHICNRNSGIGSDGLMLVSEIQLKNLSSDTFSNCDTSEISVQMHNPDSSIMGMCGNGIRCVTKYLCDKYRLKSAIFMFMVHGRKVCCETIDAGATVNVDMGIADMQEQGLQLDISGCSILGYVVSVGNPHYVVINQKLDQKRLGPILEIDPHFPNRTNVEFVKINNRSHLELAVWERGAGWTLACGTGACAAVLAAYALGLVDSSCRATLPGGDLLIQCSELNSNKLESSNSKLQSRIKMTGPATTVYVGNICL